ncbi:MAG: hypothetical protein BEU00_00190 [Marine Group III euryarchaeote CG-Epi3]|jgi:hypothetical protein|uniref:Uncharacterized protein n=1 Tax=Marine Group III euryarchaeote CG-Epi3 TaxID=1888997 RepID=A0A1J5UH89_9ARCH|nr:MAG: hypothetical protein BEU00_00190 [Marine Group III euryarchaeote CG-Epi3]|tara:strand:- start:5719 stop:7017 length:1299 start_codon:yes stop_codon:yes gene_type:complete
MSKSTDELMIEELDNEESSIGNDILSQELDEESVQELDERTVQEFEEKARFVSQREIISIVFSKKTLYHVLVLFILLAFFGIISYTKSDLASSLILIFGYGCSLGYFVTAALNRFEEVKNLSRSKSFTSLILPLSISLVFSSFFWAALNNETYGDNMERFLTWGYILIFVMWQFAQAWWMRVPFKEIALRQMSKSQENGTTKKGIILNILSPLVWTGVGVLCFSLVSKNISSFESNFDLVFILFWFLLMGMMGVITFYFLKNMHKEFLYDSKIAAFSGYFALGYWGFLSYHAGVFLYSMYNDPSFLYDLVFMVITIMLVIYSLSANVLRGEARRAHLSPTNHYIGKATGLMSRHNVIFYSISFTIAYGASNFFLATADTSLIGGIKGVSRIAHMIVLISGILVLLIVNYNLLTGRGLISEGFVESIRSPKHN